MRYIPCAVALCLLPVSALADSNNITVKGGYIQINGHEIKLKNCWQGRSSRVTQTNENGKRVTTIMMKCGAKKTEVKIYE